MLLSEDSYDEKLCEGFSLCLRVFCLPAFVTRGSDFFVTLGYRYDYIAISKTKRIKGLEGRSELILL